MKKILIIIILFFTSGCNFSNDIEVVCTKSNTVSGFTHSKKITLIFSENIIKNVTFVENYISTSNTNYDTIKSAKESFEGFIKNYKDIKTFNEIKKLDEQQEYYYEYSFDFTNMDNDDIKKINMVREYNKQILKLKEEMICE
ncbi:MAG TPA: hypothetical protein GX747_04135 [Tenericutes bacterium]|nr:hypothetical protein [Mycoplasmatota bacterium]